MQNAATAMHKPQILFLGRSSPSWLSHERRFHTVNAVKGATKTLADAIKEEIKYEESRDLEDAIDPITENGAVSSRHSVLSFLLFCYLHLNCEHYTVVTTYPFPG